MSGLLRRTNVVLCVAGIAFALGLGACGGDEAAEGDCIDADENVVDCGSAEATHELVADQSDENAIACIPIGDPPQVEVTVGDKEFCAEPLE